VEVAVKALTETRNGVRLQVSIGNETARIYEWQIARRLPDIASFKLWRTVESAFPYHQHAANFIRRACPFCEVTTAMMPHRTKGLYEP
jgi:hypothetical protein